MDSQQKVFISHASVDKPLADVLVDLLQTGMDVGQSQIFCSSLDGLGIPSGLKFVDYIRDKLKDTACAIFLLTPHFLLSRFCWGELGAAWVIDKTIYPVLFSPLEHKDVRDILTGVQLADFDSKGNLDDLKDSITKRLEITTATTAHWNVKRNEFIEKVTLIIPKLPKPESVSIEKYVSLVNDFKEAQELIKKHDQEVSRLNLVIEKLKEVKDTAKAESIILKSLPTEKQFDALVKKARSSLDELPNIVKYLIFRSYLSDDSVRFLSFDEGDKLDSAKRAEERMQVSFSDEGYCRANDKDPAVDSARDALRDLELFLIDDSNAQFVGLLARQEKIQVNLRNKTFWETYLGLGIHFSD